MNTTLPTYQDKLYIMQIPFIIVTFVEFLLFLFLAVRATCRYLPIFTSQSIAILLAFMLGYLIQAALFLKIRQSVGGKQINRQFTVNYDIYLRFVSIGHWLMYLLFYVIVYRIQIIYLQFCGQPYQKIKQVQKLMKIFIAIFFFLLIPFFFINIMEKEGVNKHKYTIIYTFGSLIALQNILFFINFIRLILQVFEMFDEQK